MYQDEKKKESSGSRRCHTDEYNKKRKWRAAYFTLEASLVVPMVLCIIVMIIHLSYYVYQKAILAQDTYLLGFRAAVLGRQQEMDATSYVAANAGEQFGNRYIGAAQPQVNTIDNGRIVKLESETEADHAAMAWHALMPDDSWKVNAGSKADVIHRGDHIRRIDRLVDLGKIALGNINQQKKSN